MFLHPLIQNAAKVLDGDALCETEAFALSGSSPAAGGITSRTRNLFKF